MKIADLSIQQLESLRIRLWRKIKRGKKNECWPWIGKAKINGYGILGLGGRGAGNVLAHRAAYELSVGPIPDGFYLCHKCDNPPCCNPTHLFVGTQLDNLRDASVKKRMRNATPSASIQRGSKHWSKREPGKVASGELVLPKLDADKVLAIRASKLPNSLLAEQYKTSINTIRAARTGRTYSWL